jgi:hypothetical protein
MGYAVTGNGFIYGIAKMLKNRLRRVNLDKTY